ncbi:MAG: hypothetical protein KGM96_10205 [Acidobacteriota bacterium]|nr:hypothetical protein [Acidobacteriota bacterium]
MKRRILLGAAACLALACSLSSAAQDKGYWRAASSTAAAITGDIAISDSKLTINFTGFVMAPIRKLGPAEVAAAFDADSNSAGSGSLYRLSVPAAKHFLHHNTLCGTADTQWMATYVEGHTLRVAFFSGSDAPVFTFDAIANSTDLCGTFTYVR